MVYCLESWCLESQMIRHRLRVLGYIPRKNARTCTPIESQLGGKMSSPETVEQNGGIMSRYLIPGCCCQSQEQCLQALR